MITIDDFKKLELRIGTVKNAEKVVGSEKLLKLTVDIGASDKRQIIAGIAAAWHEPTALIDRQVVVLANLEPRHIMGEESQGMILAASADGGPVLLAPSAPVVAGSTIR